jgi:hypothetical protein
LGFGGIVLSLLLFTAPLPLDTPRLPSARSDLDSNLSVASVAPCPTDPDGDPLLLIVVQKVQKKQVSLLASCGSTGSTGIAVASCCSFG